MPAQIPAPMNMPIPKNKKQIVGKTPAPQKYEESTVKDCMFWPQNDSKLKGKGKKTKEDNKSQGTSNTLYSMSISLQRIKHSLSQIQNIFKIF